MGTETENLDEMKKQNEMLVKLNNPQMGTETFYAFKRVNN